LGIALGAAAAATVITACGTKAKLVAQGGDCLQVTDCADGLVCVPQDNGKRICSNDLSSVQTTEDAQAPPAKDAGTKDGTTDAPAPQDTGAPPQDSGQADTAVPPQDAATE
jgi:hypothetical protein